MAIDHTVLTMLTRLQNRYALTGSLLTFGVQDVMFSHQDAEDFFNEKNYPFTRISEAERKYSKSKVQTLYESVFKVKRPMHMNDLFAMMNFGEVASLDVFDAEGPTIVHDLNSPIPDLYRQRYDVVLDIGVMEHVFDVKQFVRNCIDLLKERGTLILFLPLSGWHNECFYNFQPPFFFDVFSANGFDDIAVYLNYYPKYHDFGKGKTTWLRFEYGDRVEFRKKNYVTTIFFVGRKAQTLPQFVVPLQSHYEEYHTGRTRSQKGNTAESKAEATHYMLENMPRIIRRLFPVLVPVYRNLPLALRTPIVDTLVYVKNRSKLASRERFRC